MTRHQCTPPSVGYQFGDARKSMPLEVADYARLYEAARIQIGDVIHVRLPRSMVRAGGWTGWNVIEGESFASDAERHPVTLGFETGRDHGDEA